MTQIPCEVYSRIVGYLRPIQDWNAAKQLEFAERKTYKPEVNSETTTRDNDADSGRPDAGRADVRPADADAGDPNPDDDGICGGYTEL